ncbi:MAG TPA: hypothetical protein VGF99_22665 [Myxococcota bacterium]
MFIEVYDDATPAVVWLFAGSSNADDDHRRWLASMIRTDQAIGARRGAALLIIDDGNPPPPASVRDDITSTARSIRGKSPLAVVTTSTVARTIIAGLDFAGLVAFPIKAFANEAAAVAWLSRSDLPGVGGALDAVVLGELVAEARARVVRR